ncbi:MAG: helical backbone metal receptor [Methanoregulaceae archaeon]|jgi:iron complex transport system substrate-binding protein
MPTPDIPHLPHLRLIAVCILVLSTVASVSAAITLTDDMGTVVSIESPPQRIISLAPSNTEILFALDLGDRVVGVTEFCNYPAEALDKQKVGGYSTVSIEKVIALKPDLIVASYGNGESLLANLRSFGYPVIALHPETLAGVLDNIRLIGNAAGVDEDAARLVNDLEERIDAVQVSTMGQGGARPTVAHVIWNDPIYVSGNGTFQDELIRLAGGENAFSHLDGWQTIGIEDFILADPDVLIVNTGTGMGGGEDTIAQFFRNDPRFSRVTAIRTNQVHLIDTDTVDRAGPRIVDALEQFAEDIHPELSGNETPVAIPMPGARAPGFGTVITLAACLGAGLIAMRRML